jgi:hypothetical protein
MRDAALLILTPMLFGLSICSCEHEKQKTNELQWCVQREKQNNALQSYVQREKQNNALQ